MVSIKRARKLGVPIITVETYDMSQSIRNILADLNGSAPPSIMWDAVRGFSGLNDAGMQVTAQDSFQNIYGAPEALGALCNVPENTIVFMCNAHLWWNEKEVVQGIWNLRDAYKAIGATLVLFVVVGATPPTEIKQDVIILTDSLPTDSELRAMVVQILEAAQLKASETDIQRAVARLTGMSAFAAEQVFSLSLTLNGIDFAVLEEKANRMIEATPGLTVCRVEETLDDVRGYDNVKRFVGKLLDGDDYTVVFMDEIEKQLAGASGGDMSGTSQDQLGVFLSWMQDRNVLGILLIGGPGTGKSMVAKTAGNRPAVKRRTLQLDFGAMKDKYVGSSEQRIRAALDVISSVSHNKIVCIATCNSLAVLPPELRRRFSFGIFYFPLPSKEERNAIWELYMKRHGLKKQAMPNDAGWTGAEIRNCCLIAEKLGISLIEAANYIVPVSVSARDAIAKLEAEAEGRYISASESGFYKRYNTSTHYSTTSGETLIT